MGGTHHLPPCFLLGKGWATHPSTSLALSPIHNPHKFSSPSPFLHSHWSHLGPGTMTSVYSLLPHVLPPLYSTSHTMPECSFLKANKNVLHSVNLKLALACQLQIAKSIVNN